MVFSQPSGDGSGPPSPQGSGSDTLISLAATLAIRDGNADAIRSMLGADPSLVERFNLAYAVQASQTQEAASRLERRTEEEVEKRRAARAAYDHLVAEEEAAFRSVTDADADTFGKTLSTMELDDIAEPEFLVDGFFSRSSVAQLYGPPKSYKSFVMLDIAGCVGSGIPWQGKGTQAAKVLYIVAEGAGGIKRRVRAWEEQNKRPMNGVEFYPKAVQLSQRQEVKALIAYTKRHGFGMVVFDTQARCTVGVEENSNTDMGRVVAAIDTLKEVTGACVVLVHHSGADGQRARGATAVLGAVDSQFMVKPDKDTMSVSLITTAQKDTGEHPAIEMDLVTPGPGHALALKKRFQGFRQTSFEERLTENQEQHLRVLLDYDRAGATLTEIAKDLGGGNSGNVKKVLVVLNRKGLVAQKGSTWTLMRRGHEYLDFFTQRDRITEVN